MKTINKLLALEYYIQTLHEDLVFDAVLKISVNIVEGDNISARRIVEKIGRMDVASLYEYLKKWILVLDYTLDEWGTETAHAVGPAAGIETSYYVKLQHGYTNIRIILEEI